jgi:hypothetical protein
MNQMNLRIHLIQKNLMIQKNLKIQMYRKNL